MAKPKPPREAAKGIGLDALQLATTIMSYPPPLRSYALRLLHAMTAGRVCAQDLDNDMDWLIRTRLAGNTRALDDLLRRKLIRVI